MDEEIREKPLVTGDALAQLIGQMKPEGVQTIFGVISKEAEEFRLDTLKREILAQQCGVKDSEAWWILGMALSAAFLFLTRKKAAE